MSVRGGWVLWLALLAGCDAGEPGAAGGVERDAAVDGMVDAAEDGMPDATVDATVDAAPDPCVIEATPAVDPALGAALDAALAGALAGVDAPGVAATVVLGDGRRWAGAAGRDDIRSRASIAPWARFRVASVSKTFTAAAVLSHVEAGDWALDDAVDDWVPGFDLGPGVTLRRLLGHTAGVFNYSDDAGFLRRRTEAQTPEEVIRFALGHGPVFAPGAGYGYSNTGYYLLGLALEAVEGRSFAAVMRAGLIEPVGLSHTWMQQVEPAPGGCEIGPGHVVDDPMITEGFSMSWAWAAGGLAAPVGDLCDWARALFGGEVLTAATVAEMVAPGAASVAAGEPYGLGVMEVVRGGRVVVGHTGSIMGFRGELFFDPADGTCVAVETNDFFARPEVAAEALWSALR